MKQIQAKRQDKRRKKWRESMTLAYTFLFLATVILAFWPFWGESAADLECRRSFPALSGSGLCRGILAESVPSGNAGQFYDPDDRFQRRSGDGCFHDA